jgi:hypothetical protein
MRLILHIGMPKAGSTALQKALAKSRRALRKAGILYPKGTFNHNFLIAGMVTPAHLGRVFEQHYADNADAVGRDFTAFWRNIVDAIERHRPSMVVMSGEYLFDGLGRAGPGPLRALLAPLGAQTEIVCYVRRPSDQYLALVQQWLKASWEIDPVRPMTYRPQLEAAAAAADRLHVIPYDRSQFPDADIVADFASRFVPEAEAELRAATNPSQNASMSAEAMDIVQAFRRDRHPDENNRFTRDTGRLRRRLAEREAELGGQQRPQLLPHVRELVDQSSVDVLWLRDTFGVVFDGIDYQAVAAGPDVPVEFVTDICAVNPERRAALAELAMMTAPVEAAKPKRFRTVFRRRPRS